MSEIDNISKLEANVKKELAKFLANQSVLIEIGKKLKYVNLDIKQSLESKYNVLMERQKKLESSAMTWLSSAGELKSQIEGSIKNQSLINNFSGFITKSIPLINEGIKLSGQMVLHNGDVEQLVKSVKVNKDLTISADTNKLVYGLLYGVLGVFVTYWIVRKNK